MVNSKRCSVKQTSWPESCPKAGEVHFISVGCGNSTINWGLHNSATKCDVQPTEIQPKVTWTTPHIMEEDLDGNIPIVMASLMPRKLQEFFFGKDNEFTESLAKEEAKKRGHDITFYIVSSNDKQTERIGRLLSGIPCRVYLMKGEDFYPASWGRYEGMGVDRCACLKGSVVVYGAPVLVIDGGSAMTYTGIDSKGGIMGGGISPGLKSKLKSMNQDTGALPLIEVKQVLEMMKYAIEQKSPISVFSKNTEEAMVAAVLNEISEHYKNIIKIFQIKIANESNASEESTSVGKIVITGGSGEIIATLLGGGKDKVLEAGEDTINIDIILEKSLLHIGIGATLQEHIKRNHSGDVNYNFIDKRIAKYFDEPCAEDGDHIYRGTVTQMEMTDNGPLYSILYDDSDRERTFLPELKDMMKLFDQVGEKKPPKRHKNNKDQYIGARIAKMFNGSLYAGTVVKYDEKFFRIDYDDGDDEEFDLEELKEAIKLHQENFPNSQ